MPFRNFQVFIIILMICLTAVMCTRITGHLDQVKQTALWLDNSAIDQSRGKAWPVSPGESVPLAENLYSGTPGVVLFYLEAYKATLRQSHLEQAKAGADYLLSLLDNVPAAQQDWGFYTGLSGLGYVLGETSLVTEENKYREGMQICVQLLMENARITERGVSWTEVNDIISGNAGIGLFLLAAAEKFEVKNVEVLAVKVGDELLARGVEKEEGISWPMHPEYPRLMPNFSHGTAGTAYFLGRLYEETGKERFLIAAEAGGRRVLALSEKGLICHHIPGGEDLHYLGWCHGPAGTGRLYQLLWEITGSDSWREALIAGADAVLKSGIPENETDGFWNNAGLCCGSAGIADYFLDVYRSIGGEQYLDFSMRLTANLLIRASTDSTGMYWIQAEHRSRPDYLLPQTGLMQGAAGIGLWLLKLDAFEKGRSCPVCLPHHFN